MLQVNNRRARQAYDSHDILAGGCTPFSVILPLGPRLETRYGLISRNLNPGLKRWDSPTAIDPRAFVFLWLARCLSKHIKGDDRLHSTTLHNWSLLKLPCSCGNIHNDAFYLGEYIVLGLRMISRGTWAVFCDSLFTLLRTMEYSHLCHS
jgi:hypothetical protein